MGKTDKNSQTFTKQRFSVQPFLCVNEYIIITILKTIIFQELMIN